MTNPTLMLYASLEASEPMSGSAAFAVGAASALGAHLDVLTPFVDIPVSDNWKGRTAEQIEQESETRRQRTASLANAITNRAQEIGVSVTGQTEWAHAFGVIPFVGDQAKLRDLCVTGVDRSIFLSERKVAEHLLFDSGRPVIIVPARYAAPFACKKVTVAWDHSRTSARALHDALPFLHLADEVNLVAVGGEKQFQTSPDRATIEAVLGRKGLNVRFEQIDLGKRTIGQALQDFALERGAELLVMGAYGHSRLREFILGGATREVLDEPQLPVLMSH
ncbi:universal stress protein [Sphingorhabdus sp.]|uniref:universal stress protein n=1 Tax=Sphingorhabdus sp. TaxID=1902408 RepID=UPI0035B2E4AA